MDTLEQRINSLELATKSLDWDLEASQEVMQALNDIAQEFFQAMPQRPAWIEPKPVSLESAIPSKAIGSVTAIRELARRLLSSGIETSSPRFFGYIPSGGLPDAAAAAFIASLFNRYVGMFGAAPDAAAVENEALQWIAGLFDLSSSAWGTFASGASVATLTALLVARDQRPYADLGRLCCYFSEETHFANERALRLVGIRPEHIRKLGITPNRRLDLKQLSQAIAKDRQQGLLPWLIIGNGGTTNTGAIDDLDQIRLLSEREELWFHIDAAYGGFFYQVPELKERLKPIALADSFVVDLHKAMFFPYGCGAVFVRRGELMRQVLASGGSYTADLEARENPSANDYSVELTRPSRGAQVWVALKARGFEVYGATLQQKWLYAQWFAQTLMEHGGFDIVTGDLSVVAFRHKGEDHLTKQLLKELANEGRFLLSSTLLDGKFFIRCCVLNFRTKLSDLKELAARLMV